ncbi:MAG: hypothetical protein QXV17_08555, partial [Candidatus Micrarchaeaceae archaeon]
GLNSCTTEKKYGLTVYAKKAVAVIAYAAIAMDDQDNGIGYRGNYHLLINTLSFDQIVISLCVWAMGFRARARIGPLC